MTLVTELKAYINHKLRLAEVSDYYKRPQLQQAIQWAGNMRGYLTHQSEAIQERSLAQMVLSSQKHLFSLLPAERNTSYLSSLQKFYKIINHCRTLLQPKA